MVRLLVGLCCGGVLAANAALAEMTGVDVQSASFAVEGYAGDPRVS